MNKCMRCGKKTRNSKYDSWLCYNCGISVWGKIALVTEWMVIIGWVPR